MATKELELPTKVKMKVMMVTPEMAEEWLEKNTSNRKLSPDRIVEIMGWIRKGDWQTTTDAIGFSTEDTLINGQHRLWAIVKSKISCECLVGWGFHPDAFNKIDTNRVRSAGDVLGVNDFSYPALKAAIARFVITWKKNKYGSLVKGTGHGTKLSNQDILDFATTNKDKLEYATLVAQRTNYKFKGIGSRFLGGLYWIFAEKDKDQAETFFKYYEDGSGLNTNNPILILRTKLIQDMGSNKKVSMNAKLAWAILAWNYTRSGKTVKQIRWADGDDFPKPI